MEWSSMSTLYKVLAVLVTVICFGAVFYGFFWGRISWLPPRKK